MFPLAYRVPVALLFVAGGLLATFAGYRLFRVVLGLYGFGLGALVGSSVVGPEHGGWLILAAIVGGLAGAAILIFAYFVGVALIGAGLGALAVNLVWGQLDRDPHALVVIAAAVGGAFGALALQRYVIIIGTAFGGAWTAIVGGLALAGDGIAGSAAERGEVWLAYPNSPAAAPGWVMVAWILLGIAGVLVQLAITGRAPVTATTKT
jgi:hypothetical protein